MLKDNYEAVKNNIEQACMRSNRDLSEVTLIAVSKTKPVPMLQEIYDAGARDFGENPKCYAYVTKHQNLLHPISPFAKMQTWKNSNQWKAGSDTGSG